MKAKLTAYRGLLVFNVIAKKSSAACTLTIDHPTYIGQVIHDTAKNMGISDEAIELLKAVTRSRDDLGDVDFFKCNKGKFHFSWLGGMKQTMWPNGLEGSRDWRLPALGEYVGIDNTTVATAKKYIDAALDRRQKSLENSSSSVAVPSDATSTHGCE